jgi:hypothetical protein
VQGRVVPRLLGFLNEAAVVALTRDQRERVLHHALKLNKV